MLILILIVPSLSFDLNYNVVCVNDTHSICCRNQCLWTCQFNFPENAECRANSKGNMQCVAQEIHQKKIVGPKNFCLKQEFKQGDTCSITRDSNISFIANCKRGSTPLCCQETCHWSPSNLKHPINKAACNKHGCKEGERQICGNAEECGFRKNISESETCNITKEDLGDQPANLSWTNTDNGIPVIWKILIAFAFGIAIGIGIGVVIGCCCWKQNNNGNVQGAVDANNQGAVDANNQGAVDANNQGAVDANNQGAVDANNQDESPSTATNGYKPVPQDENPK